MSKHQCLLVGASAVAILSFANGAFAADAAPATLATSAAAVDDSSAIVITADRAGLLERRPSTTVFGLAKPLIDTPRSASLITDTNIQRYGIQTIDQLTAVAPGTFTASFYGIPGMLNVRGTLAENYFEGFKLLTNYGTFTTPIGDASRIEIVRGPPSPIYGPGFVGGFLNFIPKSAKDSGAYLTSPTGDLEFTLGSYDKKNLTGQIGLPINAGKVTGGLYIYGEIDDSGSFYDGIHPKHQMVEVSGRFDLPDDWSFDADFMYYHSTGDVQTVGWNRLTQDLVDNQTYITGHNTSLSTGGAPYLSPNQATPSAPYYPYNYNNCGDAGLACLYPYFSAPGQPSNVLNADVGTTKLSPHTVYVSSQDFSDTWTPTIYAGLSKELPGDSVLKFEFFFNQLENKRYVSYGFPAWLRGTVVEARGTYNFKLSTPDDFVQTNTIVGVSGRVDWSHDMQTYDSGLIALDRRDLSVGATPTDSLCSPFDINDTGDQKFGLNCMGWETDIHSTWSDIGEFVTSDIMVAKQLDLVLGGRLDEYNARSSDTGILAYEDAGPVSKSKTVGTYSASLSYKLPWGVMPYVTYAESSALEFGQISDLATSLLDNGGWIQNSTLKEVGLKFQFLNGTLVGSVDVYDQDRPQLQGQGTAVDVVNTVGKGVEFEARWVATKNFSFTFAGNSQHTLVIGPDHSFQYLPAFVSCGNNLACELNSWGGQWVTFDYASVAGLPTNYEYTPIPHSVLSFYANYISDEHSWGRGGVTIGFTHTSKTSGTVPGAVVYPAYFVVNASAFYQKGPIEIDLNVDNLFDKLYFIPAADTYVNMGVLPGVGREFRLTLKGHF